MKTYKQAPVIGSRRVDESAEGSRAKVYFTRVIDAAHLISLYTRINDAIYGKVAIKLHTGEKHGPNILPRDMVAAFQKQVKGSTIVETNTLYQGDRYTTEMHRDTLQVNGWADSAPSISWTKKGLSSFQSAAASISRRSPWAATS